MCCTKSTPLWLLCASRGSPRNACCRAGPCPALVPSLPRAGPTRLRSRGYCLVYGSSGPTSQRMRNSLNMAIRSECLPMMSCTRLQGWGCAKEVEVCACVCMAWLGEPAALSWLPRQPPQSTVASTRHTVLKHRPCFQRNSVPFLGRSACQPALPAVAVPVVPSSPDQLLLGQDVLGKHVEALEEVGVRLLVAQPLLHALKELQLARHLGVVCRGACTAEHTR